MGTPYHVVTIMFTVHTRDIIDKCLSSNLISHSSKDRLLISLPYIISLIFAIAIFPYFLAKYPLF